MIVAVNSANNDDRKPFTKVTSPLGSCAARRWGSSPHARTTSEQTALTPLPGQARKLRIASLLPLSKRDPLRWARVLLFGTMVCILSDQQSHIAADAISFAAPFQTANAALVCSLVFGNRRSKASFAPAFFAEMPFAPLPLLSKSPRLPWAWIMKTALPHAPTVSHIGTNGRKAMAQVQKRSRADAFGYGNRPRRTDYRSPLNCSKYK